MTNLVPTNQSPQALSPSGGGLTRREQRQLARTRTGLSLDRDLSLERIESKAMVESARAHAVGYVGQQAMQAVTMLSQLEGQLAQTCPLATTRLQGIADMTALSIAQVVADAAHRLR
jgi:hypothetical protein